jgi:hypothetical protein
MYAETPMGEQRLRRCPRCGRALPDEAPLDAAPSLWEAFGNETAAARKLSRPWMFLITSLLVATGIGSVLFHRDAGAVVAASACFGLGAALWYGRISARRRDPR